MFSDLLYRLRSLFRREAVESEADAELRFHFERQVEKYLKTGMTREEAVRRARIEFGGHEQLKEEIRDARGVNLIETFFQDIRYGLRTLGRTPIISCIAVLSLALGIGANTAIFSLIDSVMLRMLPVANPEELVQLRILNPQSPNGGGRRYLPIHFGKRCEIIRVFSLAFSPGVRRNSTWRKAAP